MDKKVLKFETTTSNFEQVNEEFMRVKVHVCYAGKNRNGSIIEKDVLDRMAQTVYGVPVVGELDEENMRFKGHGGKLEISDEGWKEIKTTIPYGFVDPTTPFTYESVLEHDGMTTNEYLTVACYLWKGRYPELVEVFEKNTVKQSMEIMVESGNWDDNWEYFNITQARFQALCLLGVEPCFESSKATIGYSLENHETLYQEMLDRFKQFTLETAGGETMPEAEVIQEVQEVQEVEAPEVVEEVVEETVEETIEVVENEEVVVEEAIEESTEEPVAVEEGAEFEAPEAEEPATEEVVEEVAEETVEDEEEVVATEDSEPEVDYQARIEELEMALAEATRELEAVKAENARLAEFEATVKAEQRKGQEEALFAQFASLEGFEGYAELVENAKQYSIEDLETKLFALLGKKNFSMTNKPKKQGSAKLPVGTPTTEARTYYGGRFDKYLK